VLYYDTLLVLTADAAVTERIKQRFTSNIEKCGSLPFGKAIKECTSFSHKSLRKQPLNYLGCEFTIRRKCTRETEQLSLMWRVRPDKNGVTLVLRLMKTKYCFPEDIEERKTGKGYFFFRPLPTRPPGETPGLFLLLPIMLSNSYPIFEQ